MFTILIIFKKVLVLIKKTKYLNYKDDLYTLHIYFFSSYKLKYGIKYHWNVTYHKKKEVKSFT